jgi:hypothetical protein
MHSSMLLILLLCASSGWGNVAASLADESVVKFRTGVDAMNKLRLETLQSDEKKEKKSTKQTAKSAKKKSKESEKDGKPSGAEAKEEADNKTPDATAKKEAAKKEDGLSWLAILMIVVVAGGAGAGIMLLLMRRKSAGTIAPDTPKALLGSTEAEAIVVENKVLHQDAASKGTAEVKKDIAREPAPIRPELHTEQISETLLVGKATAVQPVPTPPPLQAQPATTATDKKAETAETEAKSTSPEKSAAAPSEPDTTGMLLDDNSIDTRESKVSNEDFALLNELTQKPEPKQEEELLSDQLIMPEDECLLIDPSDAVVAETSLLEAYQRISTPEDENEFMHKVWVGTIANFEEVFGNPAAKPVFVENSEGSFLISKHVSEEVAEVFILRNFPIHDFLMQESLTPVFELQSSKTLLSGFSIKLPARVKKGELGWQLVSKGEILIPA